MVKHVRVLIFLGALMPAGSGFTASGEGTPSTTQPPPAPPPASPILLPAGSTVLVIPAAILLGVAAAVSGGDPDTPAVPSGSGSGTR